MLSSLQLVVLVPVAVALMAWDQVERWRQRREERK